jgi:hypothetical protein
MEKGSAASSGMGRQGIISLPAHSLTGPFLQEGGRGYIHRAEESKRRIFP